ncbi:MAG TPA: DUF488 domain-containing protein [Solirubrobacteraceae bacterium]|nr:DUF488 domain-containing protein [Solirubrobacteraceae bacterium]
MDSPMIYTVGHSTRSLDELSVLLDDAHIRELVDVRRVPRSQRHPQFAGEALAGSLPAQGIAYVHEAALGGFRRPRPDSPNTGWEHPAFRGYADYMASEEFRGALERLQTQGRERGTCLMCAEAQWWRCHRRLISDALVIRGWRVLHLGLHAKPVEHELTPFAVRGEGHALSYPAPQAQLELETGLQAS